VPYYSLEVTRLIDVIALIVFGVVGAVIGILVHVLAGRARQTARAQAEADQLARLAAGSLADPHKPAAELAAELRAAFDLDAVGILTRSGDGWQVLAGAGGALPAGPDAAQFAAEIAPGRVLVMNGPALTAPDTHRLQAFTTEFLVGRPVPAARRLAPRRHPRTGWSIPAATMTAASPTGPPRGARCGRSRRLHACENAGIMMRQEGGLASRSRVQICSASSCPAATDMVRSNASSSARSRT
jgi:hypothetical protein